jgi:hypothetical protein
MQRSLEQLLDPNLIAVPWISSDSDLLLHNYTGLGPGWTAVSGYFKGRTGAMIRSRFNALQKLRRDLPPSENMVQ